MSAGTYPNLSDPAAMATFASNYVLKRLEGFAKDIRICLTAIPHPTEPGKATVAYFPALGLCCATLDYLSSLFAGRIRRGVHPPTVNAYANQYLPQPDYNEETTRLLFSSLRHTIAHRGIAGRVWIEEVDQQPTGRRFSWKVYKGSGRPAVRVVPETGHTDLAPWPCAYTHRTHVHLTSFARDLKESGTVFATDLRSSSELVAGFTACMRQVFPA